MKNTLEQFLKQISEDKALQEKLQARMKAFTGEKTEKAAFDGVLVPLAKENGLEVSFEDLEALRAETDLSADELQQAAGGFSFKKLICLWFGENDDSIQPLPDSLKCFGQGGI